jgi:hypothetical protein
VKSCTRETFDEKRYSLVEGRDFFCFNFAYNSAFLSINYVYVEVAYYVTLPPESLPLYYCYLNSLLFTMGSV